MISGPGPEKAKPRHTKGRWDQLSKILLKLAVGRSLRRLSWVEKGGRIELKRVVVAVCAEDQGLEGWQSVAACAG